MPAETIHASDGFDLRIAWGANADMIQVASVHGDHPDGTGGAERVITMVNEWLAEAGLDPIDWDTVKATLAAAGKPPHFNGWHATLPDRRAVNQLLHVLKRARDHSFGRDK